MEWILYLAWSLVSTIMAAYIWGRRRVHGTRPFVLAILCAAAWSLLQAIELIAMDPLVRLVANHLCVGLLAGASALWLIFVLQYTGHGRWLKTRNIALLLALPVASVALALLNGLLQFESRPASAILEIADARTLQSMSLAGIWHWLTNVYTFLVVVASAVLLVGVLANTPRYYRGQVAILITGLAVPSLWISLIAPIAESGIRFHLTPYLLVISAAVIAVGVFRYRLLDIVPIGQEIVVHTMADPVFVADVFHNIVDLNPAAERLISQSAAQIIGQPISRVLKSWPDVAQKYSDADGAQVTVLETDGTGQSYSAQMAALTGRRGNRIGYLITFHDVTRIRAAEEALRASEARYRTLAEDQSRLIKRLQEQASYLNTLIESSGNAIMAFDLDGRVLSWNRAAEVTYGWSKDEAIGQTLPMVSQKQRDEIRHLFASLGHSGGSLHNLEVNWQRRNGNPITALTTLSAVRGINDSKTSILSISTDVSQEKRLEQDVMRQQRAVAILEERTRLARELHDSIGQVLSYVRMQTYTARHFLSRGWTNDAVNLLERIIEVAQNSQTELRDQILSLSVRSAADARTPGLVSMLRAYVNDLTRDSPLRTEFNATPEVDGLKLAWDAEAQVIRIVQEAIANVRKHADAQFMQIELKRDAENFMAVVEDDGRGFDPETISSASERRFGLRIMVERAQEIGGHLQIVSAPGKGTRVTLVIPMKNIAV